MFVDRKDPSVVTILNMTFPEYNGKNIQIHTQDNVCFFGTMWDGGTRYRYRIFDLKTSQVVSIPPEQFLQPDKLHRDSFSIPDEVVVVRKQDGYREHVELICKANTLVPMLPYKVELSETEKTVLYYTASLKSSYGGISNYRFYSANRETKITQTDWNTAKERLIVKGFLDKRGAITILGRNNVQRPNQMPSYR